MKLTTLKSLLLLALGLSLSAACAHAHGKNEAGPNNGRLLTSIEPHAEFFVTPERKVQITFLDKKDRPVAVGEQTVTVTTGSRQSPVTLTFSKSGTVLLSDAALPAGNNLLAVVQIKLSASAKPVTEKFSINLALCPECKNAEYACLCDH